MIDATTMINFQTILHGDVHANIIHQTGSIGIAKTLMVYTNKITVMELNLPQVHCEQEGDNQYTAYGIWLVLGRKMTCVSCLLSIDVYGRPG